MSFSNILKEILEKEREKLIRTDVDIVFCIDCTGSMGSWINICKTNILRIIENLRSNFLIKKLRIGVVGYRDFPPQDSSYITTVHPFSDLSQKKNVTALEKFTAGLSAGGGGDCPESLSTAIRDVVTMDWSNTSAKTCVIFTDAPPHGVGYAGDGFPNGDPNGCSWLEECYALREMHVVTHCIICGGNDQTRRTLNKISGITRGSSMQLEERFIQEIIIGAGEDTIDKNRVKVIVERSIEKEMEALKDLDHEYDRVDHMLKILAGEEVYTRRLAGFCMDQRDFNVNDLVDSINLIRRQKPDVIIPLFPTVGILEREKNIGLLTEKDKEGTTNEKEYIFNKSLQSVDIKTDIHCGIMFVKMKFVYIAESKTSVFKFPILHNMTEAKIECPSANFSRKTIETGLTNDLHFELPEILPKVISLKYEDLKEKEEYTFNVRYAQVLRSTPNQTYQAKISSLLLPPQKIKHKIIANFQQNDVKIISISPEAKCKVSTEELKNVIEMDCSKEKQYMHDFCIEFLPTENIHIGECKSGYFIDYLVPGKNNEKEEEKLRISKGSTIYIIVQTSKTLEHKFLEIRKILMNVHDKLASICKNLGGKKMNFDVIKFNTKAESLFNGKSVPLNLKNLKKFKLLIDHNITINFGAQLWPIFGLGSNDQKKYSKKLLKDSSAKSKVLLISNGNIYNSNKLLNIVKSAKIPIYSIGLDCGFNPNGEYLLEKLGRACGNGCFMEYKNEKTIKTMFKIMYNNEMTRMKKEVVGKYVCAKLRINAVVFDKLAKKIVVSESKKTITIEKTYEMKQLNEFIEEIPKL